MKYGIQEEIWEQINTVFLNQIKIEKVLLFGSRAKNTFKNGSDVDLAIFGEGITHQELMLINIRLEDIGIFQSIDAIDFNKINNPDLIEHIQRVGINIFNRLNP